MSAPDLSLTQNNMQETGREQKSNWFVAHKNWFDFLNIYVINAYF